MTKLYEYFLAAATIPTNRADRQSQMNPSSARAAATDRENVHSDPPLSLLGSGYKSMSQIKNEQREQNNAARRTQKAKAARSTRQQPVSTTTTSAAATNTVNTTTLNVNKSDPDELDETLALALQLSLEHNLPKTNKPVTTKPKRVHKETPVVSDKAKNATPGVQPSSQLKKNLFTRQPPTTSTGKAAERRQLQQRALEKQVLEDANRQFENDRRAAEDLHVQLNREAATPFVFQ